MRKIYEEIRLCLHEQYPNRTIIQSLEALSIATQLDYKYEMVEEDEDGEEESA